MDQDLNAVDDTAETDTLSVIDKIVAAEADRAVAAYGESFGDLFRAETAAGRYFATLDDPRKDALRHVAKVRGIRTDLDPPLHRAEQDAPGWSIENM